MKLSFNFKSSAKPAAAPKPKPVPVLSMGDDDDEPISIETDPKQKSKKKFKLAPPTQSIITKAQQQELEEQQKIDSTVFEYDEVWDRMKASEREAQVAREEEAKLRKPKYINNLLQSADVRKLDHLRAEEKMIQREREAEGDEFADKEKFVTQAYKDQVAAMRIAEQEEKERAELAKKQRNVPATGMNHFYRSLLQQSEEKHAAAMAAASKPVIGPTMPPEQEGANFAIRRPDSKPKEEPKEVSDLEKARKAKAEGKEIELNDDNQIVDKRELLSAGLNLSGKNTRDLASLRKGKNSKAEGESAPIHTAVGAAASRQEIEARRRREIVEQVEEEKARAKVQREKEEQEARERIVKRKNDDDSVQSALERYRERKRRKLEDVQQNASNNAQS